MPRPPKAGLTDYELAIMRLLWKESPLPVARILSLLPRRPRPAYTSLLTGIRMMEKKGYLGHQRKGKAHLFYPLLRREEYRRIALRRMVAGLYEGDALELAYAALKSAGADRTDWKKLKKRVFDA